MIISEEFVEFLHWIVCIYYTGVTVSTPCTYNKSQMHPVPPPTNTTSFITSAHAHSHKQTVKQTYSLSYLRLVNKHWEAVKAGKLSKPETTVCLMNWAASQHNISSSLGLKQTTQLLIGRAAWSRCEECTLPTSTVASQRLDRQQQELSESLHGYVTVWPSVYIYTCTDSLYSHLYLSIDVGIDVFTILHSQKVF